MMNRTSAKGDLLETVPGARAATARRVPASAPPQVVVATARDFRAGSVLIRLDARLPAAVFFEAKQ